MQVRHVVNPKVYDDADQKNALFALDRAGAEQIIDGFDGQHGGRFAIAAAGSTTLDIGGLASVRGVYLEADGDLSVTLNGGSALLLRRADATTGRKAKLFFEGTVTTLALANAGTAKVSGVYCVWGSL